MKFIYKMLHGINFTAKRWLWIPLLATIVQIILLLSLFAFDLIHYGD